MCHFSIGITCAITFYFKNDKFKQNHEGVFFFTLEHMKLSTYICTCTSAEIHTHTDGHMKTPPVASSAGSIKCPGVKTFPTLILRVSAPAVPWGMGPCSKMHRCTKTTSPLSPLSPPHTLNPYYRWPAHHLTLGPHMNQYQ